MIDFRDDLTVSASLRENRERQQLIGRLVTVGSLFARDEADDRYKHWIIVLREGPQRFSWPLDWFMTVNSLASLVQRYRG